MSFCIPKNINKKIIKSLETGDLDVKKLLKADYTQLEDTFTKIIGNDKYSTELSERFVSRFKTQVTKEDSLNLYKLFTKFEKEKLEGKISKDGLYAPAKGDEIKPWARTRTEIDRYIENITNPDNELSLPKSIKKFFTDEIQRVKDQDTLFKQIMRGGLSLVNMVTAPVYKSILASFDASYALRQGFKVLTKDLTDLGEATLKGEKAPASAWKKSMEESWKVWKKIKSKKLMQQIIDEHKMILMSKENYSKFVDNGLAIDVIEDWFPTTVAEKIPIVGNAFKASNEAFTIFSRQARYSVAEKMYEKQLLANGGKELSDEMLKDIMQMANAVSGRGSLGRFEASSGALNKLFFSARFIRSQFDTFAMPFNMKLAPEIRAEATKHLVGTLGTIGALMATASAFTYVETDPRSANFGKMKTGNNTWVDLTAGLGSYIALATREATSKSKSARTGKISKLNTGKFGSRTRYDVLSQWASNKLAPGPSAFKSVFLSGKDFIGRKPTPGRVAVSLGVPITLGNLVQLMQQEQGAVIVGDYVADTLGMSASTFSKQTH